MYTAHCDSVAFFVGMTPPSLPTQSAVSGLDDALARRTSQLAVLQHFRLLHARSLQEQSLLQQRRIQQLQVGSTWDSVVEYSDANPLGQSWLLCTTFAAAAAAA
jgi:hypothetical protein